MAAVSQYEKKLENYEDSTVSESRILKKIGEQEERLGKNYPGLTESLVALAQIYESKDMHEESEEIYRRVLKLCEDTFVHRYGFRHFLSDIFRGNPKDGNSAELFKEENVLALSPDLVLGASHNRSCYAHPDNPDRCIKIDKPWNEGTFNSRRARIKKALMPWLASISCNGEEARFYWTKARMFGAAIYRHAPRCYGITMTNQGPGLVFERVRDLGGNYSDRLDSYLMKNPDKSEHLLLLLDELFAFFQEMDLIPFCINSANLLVKQDSIDGDRLVVIDWKSEHKPNDDLPFTTIFPFLTWRKMTRKVQDLKRQIQRIKEDAHVVGLNDSNSRRSGWK